jgi:hypothetical protein
MTEFTQNDILQCIIKSAFAPAEDYCVRNPINCKSGLSFSIWEKVRYGQEIFNIEKEHPRKYIFSTGGDHNETMGFSYPGLALYHEGIDVIAVVSTGEEVYNLKVRGPLNNLTWTNIGIRWEPFNFSSNKPISERGGLEVSA